MTLSSLASPNFATSYQLGSVGVVDGSISYLWSSVPLRLAHHLRSEAASLPRLLRAYRPLSPLLPPAARRRAASLLCGRLYLPLSQLEALAVARPSPALQLQLSAVSARHLRDGGTLLGLAQYDAGRYAFEGLASSDGGLLGLRGIYNFGGDSHDGDRAPVARADDDREPVYGRFSTGGEIYYGTLNKSGGVSLSGRFATLPAHRGTPLSATLTLNPLMGNVAASYAVVAGRHCSLATRIEFNVFSYESAWAVGMELWRRRNGRRRHDEPARGGGPAERSWQAKLEWRLDDEYAGVLKARLDQRLRIGVLWEGRIKSLLFSLGSGIDLRRLDKPFRTLGLEIQFSS